jgi:ACR3 family arsenite transporter
LVLNLYGDSERECWVINGYLTSKFIFTGYLAAILSSYFWWYDRGYRVSFLVESILIILLIPLVLAFLTKIFLINKQQLRENIISNLNVLPIIFLNLAIVAMFASQGQILLDNFGKLPILLFFIINFFVGQKIGQLMRFPTSYRTSLSLTILAKNSPIALAIAMTAFPNEPLIALTLVIGPLLELPILAFIAQILVFISRGKSI